MACRIVRLALSTLKLSYFPLLVLFIHTFHITSVVDGKIFKDFSQVKCLFWEQTPDQQVEVSFVQYIRNILHEKKSERQHELLSLSNF